MKDIGIFGDSFATDNSREPHVKIKNGWTNMLIAEGADVGIHAQAGASIDFIVDSFIKHHSEYNKLIVVLGNPRRKIWCPVEVTNKMTNEKRTIQHWYPNTGFLDKVIEENYGDMDILNAIDSWQKYLSRAIESQLETKEHIITTYMKAIRPDVILLPSYYPVENYIWSFRDIDTSELASITPHPYTKEFYKYFPPFIDPRPNHFSVETNKWILKHIKGRLNNEFIDWNRNETHKFKTLDELYSIYGKVE